MPASTNVKRVKVYFSSEDQLKIKETDFITVKNTRIERPFVIGSEAWPLDESNRKPDTPEDHTKGWRVYVKAPEGQPDITRWLKKVQFKIYHTYQNPTRLVDTPPFQIEETGWGGFNVEVRLFFPPEASLKPEYRSHFLQLEPYGDEALRTEQESKGLVRSELLDYVEFNEPPEAFYDALTSEGQWGGGGKKSVGRPSGKGKAKKESLNGADGGASAGEGTVELKEVSTQDNAFSKQLEQQIIDVLRRAEKTVDEELATTARERQAIEKELKEVKSTAPKP